MRVGRKFASFILAIMMFAALRGRVVAQVQEIKKPTTEVESERESSPGKLRKNF